jgi:hypothetical protein
MHETRFDVVKLILGQMICKKCLVRDSIYFAPYIMSLIKTKTGFNCLCDVKHEIYRPFYNAKAFLNKTLTPYGQVAEAQNVAENVEVHASDDENAMLVTWVMLMLIRILMLCHLLPLEFIPCSHGGSLLQSMNSQFQQMQSGFNSHFEAYGQQMNDTFQTMSVFWTGNLLRGVPEVDECDSPRSVTRRKRHATHNLDRFGPRGA